MFDLGGKLKVHRDTSCTIGLIRVEVVGFRA